MEFSDDTGRVSLRTKLTNLYGEELYRKTNLFRLLRVKISRNLARLAFLKRCRDSRILPNCVKLKHHKNNKQVHRILQKAEEAILRNQISEARYELHKATVLVSDLQTEFLNKFDPEDWNLIDRLTQKIGDRVHKINTEKHKKKFEKLQRDSRPNHVPDQHMMKNVIVNLTDEDIDQATTTLLQKGLNFAIAPKKIPTEEIICSVEAVVKDLTPLAAEEVRQDVATVLRKSKPPKSNLSRDERRALQALKEDESKLILPADKGNATVIMKTENYKEKMNNMLDDGPYRAVRNPTKRITTLVNKSIRSNAAIEDNVKRFLINSDPKPPLLYGLPKIHKEGIPMRPIVSSIGSPTYNVAKYVSRLLSDCVGKTASYVKDSRHFIEIIKAVKCDECDLMVSFDVESLFTKVPIPETIEIIKGIKSAEVAELAKICLTSTYFFFDGKYYEQTDGAAMGSPLSPVAANLYMEYFEKKALEEAQLKPKLWVRYVDDVWAVWPHGREKLEGFLQHLNSIHPNIKFTIEVENNRNLPFLDVLTTRNPDGSIGHSVYRKPTHTNRYLNAKSHHHPAQKLGVLNTLINRAIHISDKNNWNTEKNILHNTLLENGYTKAQINKAFTNQISKINCQTDQEPGPQDRPKAAYVPYIQGTTDKIGRILKKHNIRTVFRPANKLRNCLRPVKDTIPLCTPGVYEIPCSCGSVYIGETKRLISTRLHEHIRHTKQENTEKSAIAEHSFKTKHTIEFDKTKVLAKIPHYYPRIVRETIEIIKKDNNFNKEDSIKLSKAWQPVLKKSF